MSKLNKFLVIFVLSFILIASGVFAADITNLDSTNENPDASQEMPSAEDRVSEENASTANDLLNGVVNSGANQSTDDTSTPKISSISQSTSVPEANLRLSNILSIILISIGIVLILLAIAILIKLGK